MNTKTLKNKWLEEEQRAFQGWDFSHLDGRALEETFPWNYDKVVRSHLKKNDVLLDMGTGGGEYLLSLNHPYKKTFVTESYLPNVNYCMERLVPFGITVKQIFDDEQVPYEDHSFDIIINRHESFSAKEVYRLLKPNGYFITQQVGGENNHVLSKFLIEGFVPEYPHHDLRKNKEMLESVGFQILQADEYFPYIKFFDVGAIVFYAKIIEWEFPGFSVEKHFDKLLSLHETISKQGYYESKEHRFFIMCRK